MHRMDGGNTIGANFDPSKTTGLICECGNHTFQSAYLLREVSEILSPTGKAGIIPIPVFTCNSCGRVPDKLVPKFLKESEATETAPKSNLILEK